MVSPRTSSPLVITALKGRLMLAVVARSGMLLVLCGTLSGCAMCGSCDDYTYPTSGGAWERLDPSFGRVGSAFTPEVGTKVVPDRVTSETPEVATPPEGELPEPQELQSDDNESRLLEEPAPMPPPAADASRSILRGRR